MDRNFAGFPAYLIRAAEELGFDPAMSRGAPPAALAAMANLCAQATASDPVQAAEILKEAVAFRDRLKVAARASELMLADVARANPEAEAPARPKPGRQGRPNPHRP